jgi:hypothetical protein
MYTASTRIGQLGQPVLPPEGEPPPRFPSPAGAVGVAVIFAASLAVAFLLLGKR